MRLIITTVCIFLCASSANAAEFHDKQHVDALKEVMSEARVVDAAWLSSASLIVGVWDDGSDRTGFASYLCMVLADHGIKGGVVRILDQGASIRKKEWKELGKAWCQQ